MTDSNEQIRVLAIAPYRFLPAMNGGQKNIALFYKYLSALISFTCATVKGTTKSNADGNYDLLPIFSGSPLRYINPFYFFVLKKIIRERNITHVMLEHPYYGWLGWLLKKFAGVKLVIHSHNIEGLRFKSIGKWWWRILWQYEKKIHRAADMSFFITPEDKLYAITHFGLKEDKCTIVTYGTERNKAPTGEEKYAAKKIVCYKHNLNPDKPLLLYSAALKYQPNLSGLDFILSQLNPLLVKSGQPYTILICGSGLPYEYNDLRKYSALNITYAGFVDDIDEYFTAADIFLNPVSEGGGIKTKVVEALAANCTVISFENGAWGIPENICNNKLKITANYDAHFFANEILNAIKKVDENISSTFFNYFKWKNIAQKAQANISSALPD
ncbi:MAG: glycosyltransferase family 4 protein [Chitinophagaceae bacterium]|nr:glycosyltransferase family 4 protein [Chitinophagaceae bacterium]